MMKKIKILLILLICAFGANAQLTTLISQKQIRGLQDSFNAKYSIIPTSGAVDCNSPQYGIIGSGQWTNNPADAFYGAFDAAVLQTTIYSSNIVEQVYTSYYDGRTWKRTEWTGTWGLWREIFSSASMIIPNTIYKSFETTFPNLANQSVDIILGGGLSLNGHFTISVISTYSNQNLSGIITKSSKFEGAGSSIYSQEAHYTEATGAIADYFIISDIHYNSTIGSWVVTVSQIPQFNNPITILLSYQAQNNANALALIDAFSIGTAYTDLTTYPTAYSSFKRKLILEDKLQVNNIPTFSSTVTNVLTDDGTGIISKRSLAGLISDIGGSGGSGTVTSVGMTTPTGLSISGSPITTSGTLALSMASGYSIPTTASQADWNTAFGWGNHATQGYLKGTGTTAQYFRGDGSLATFPAQVNLTGTANRLTVTGTYPNLTANIATNYVGQTSITTLGTVSTGTWNASTIAVNKGGSGATTLTGYLKGNGTSPFTASATIPIGDISGTIPNISNTNLILTATRELGFAGEQLTFKGGRFKGQDINNLTGDFEIRPDGTPTVASSDLTVTLLLGTNKFGTIRIENNTGGTVVDGVVTLTFSAAYPNLSVGVVSQLSTAPSTEAKLLSVGSSTTFLKIYVGEMIDNEGINISYIVNGY